MVELWWCIFLVWIYTSLVFINYLTKLHALKKEIGRLKDRIRILEDTQNSLRLLIRTYNDMEEETRKIVDDLQKEATERAAEEAKREKEYQDYLDGIDSINNYTYDVARGVK